jgi:hypothetical protein
METKLLQMQMEYKGIQTNAWTWMIISQAKVINTSVLWIFLTLQQHL